MQECLSATRKPPLEGYGEVWYNPKAITNIVSFGNAEESGKYDITYNSDTGFTMKNKETGKDSGVPERPQGIAHSTH